VLAENERYGGMSPHVSPFAEISDLGNMLGIVGYKIPTIIKEEGIQFFMQKLSYFNHQ
jgi:NADH dehydrogenase [ubiquinone] 1 alpha subcomplex assembly factor 5